MHTCRMLMKVKCKQQAMNKLNDLVRLLTKQGFDVSPVWETQVSKDGLLIMYRIANHGKSRNVIFHTYGPNAGFTFFVEGKLNGWMGDAIDEISIAVNE